ncbi:lipid droplet-regulating VLDL assembly factor AUP1-like [Artemia franciscana]|uniref:lipid droplet-regulating VLDL assembly factor AUP1-like n=1 Tax=Artemia franciscana TaxID=6661 RepID=UPI0032DB5BB3
MELISLFDAERIQCQSVGSLFGFLIYFPFGVLLFFLRLLILIPAYTFVSFCAHHEALKRRILSHLSVVFGVTYEERSKKECNNEPCSVYISNHVTAFDGIVFYLANGCIAPAKPSFPSVVCSLFGLFGVPSQISQDDMVSLLKRKMHNSEKSLVLYPECATTNGKKGMLRFSSFAFCINDVVYPVAVQVSRPPFLSILPSVLDSTLISDLFWILFTPYTKYSFRYLPSVRKQEGEEVEHFAKRTQELIASTLDLTITNFLLSDKVELIKRQRIDRETARRRREGAGGRAFNRRILSMADQVKEILPHVPLNVIIADLRRTRSVDITIANILVGSVLFTPEPVPEPVSARPSTSASSGSSPFSQLSLKASGPTTTVFPSDFHKKTDDRQMSLQERKARFLDNARRAYIEKRGLKIPGYNC